MPPSSGRGAEPRRSVLAGAIETESAGALHERAFGFHEAIIAVSPENPCILGTFRRINRVRRLLSYRSTNDWRRYRQQCTERLRIRELLEAGKNEDAGAALQRLLEHTVQNFRQIGSVLEH